MIVTRLCRAACLALVVTAVPGAAWAVDPLEYFFGSTPLVHDERLPGYTNEVAVCGAPWVLKEVQERFDGREQEYWHSGLQILAYENPVEVRGLPHAAFSIAQRECSVTAIMNDNRAHTIHYALAEKGGVFALIDGVDFCVAGLDTFARDCNKSAPVTRAATASPAR